MCVRVCGGAEEEMDEVEEEAEDVCSDMTISSGGLLNSRTRLRGFSCPALL